MKLFLPNVNMDNVTFVSKMDLTGMYIPKYTINQGPDKSIFNEVLSQDPRDSSFYINTKSGNKIVIVTCSCEVNNDTGDRVIECWWCPKKYNSNNNVGIITSLKTKEGKVYVKRVGFTCSEQCSLAWVKEEQKKGIHCPSVYHASDTHHKALHKMMYPDGPPLLPSKDPKFLIEKGGTMSWEEWSNGDTKFIDSDFIVIQPLRELCVKRTVG